MRNWRQITEGYLPQRAHVKLPWLAFFLIRPVPAVIHGPPANLVVQGTEEESLLIQRKARADTIMVVRPAQSATVEKMCFT